MTVMIVDDSKSCLMRLASLVQQAADVETVTFISPEAALEETKTRIFDIVIVDHIMPGIDGITFIQRMRAMSHHGRTPIVMFTATGDELIKIRALEAGATDFLSKSPHPLELRIKLRNLMDFSWAMRKLDERVNWLAREVATATQDLLAREEEMIFRLSKAVEFRDNDTGDHTLRVAQYSRMIAEELGVSWEHSRDIFLAAPLHDVGKVAIPDGILLKPGKLDESEMAVIRTHAEVGQQILGDSNSKLIQLASQIAGNHHERWDGKGYPNGIAGDAIPLCARIVAVADVFDALTTERPYKSAMPIEAALEHLRRERGRHFDPACVDAFLASYARTREHPASAETPAAAAG